MKRFLMITAAAALLTTGCSKDETPAPGENDRKAYSELGASLGQTRTTLKGSKIHWTLGDILSVWSDEKNMPVNYTLFDGVDSPVARFRTEGDGVSGTKFYAVYPSSLVTGPGELTLPVTQEYKDVENFATNTFPMASVSNDPMNMAFENLCGVLVVELSGANYTVQSIELKAFGQALAGTASIDFSGPVPTLNCSGTNTLTLKCGGVSLVEAKKAFYFVVPAGTYEQGIDISIVAESRDNGTETVKKKRTSSFTVNPGTVTRIGASFTLSSVRYAVGDLYEAGGKRGVVFDVDATGRSGKIMALTDCSAGGTETTDEFATYYYYTWGPSASAAVTANAADGWQNMENVVSKGIGSYPAFQACASLGDGWYLPASGEIQAVVNAASYCTLYGGSDMWGVGYWCSNTTGNARQKSIFYYDALAGGTNADPFIKTVRTNQQATVTNSVRAIAAF